MIAAHSERLRRVVFRLDRGTEFLDQIVKLCQKHQIRSGTLRAWGWLDAATLAAGRRLGPPLHMVLCQGLVAEQDSAVAPSAHVLLSRETDAGVQIVGGALASAQVLLVEGVIEAYDDLVLERGVDAATGLPGLSDAVSMSEPEAGPAAEAAPSPPPPPPPPPREDAEATRNAKEAALLAMRHGAPAKSPAARPAPEASSKQEGRLEGKREGGTEWDQVKAASATTQLHEELLEAALKDPPHKGDIVQHGTFGRCVVERYEENHERLSLRVRSGRLVQVSLEFLGLELIGKEGSARVFHATVKPRVKS